MGKGCRTNLCDGWKRSPWVNWSFNAWGGTYDGLYQNWQKDDKVAEEFCKLTGYDYYDAAPFVLEGGSIHSDGQGTVIATEACLLSKGRNPELTKEQIEAKLQEYLGAEKIIWLPNGIYQDETNEHVDNVCAFINRVRLSLHGQMTRVIRSTHFQRKILRFLNRRQTPKEGSSVCIKC